MPLSTGNVKVFAAKYHRYRCHRRIGLGTAVFLDRDRAKSFYFRKSSSSAAS
jgi:hypothetical protein